jgi:mannose-6-phosphate isomerase-like protein (cupin superfamily)
VDQSFGTMRLPATPDAVAPDGSDVRVLLQLSRGGMAHFELAPGRVSHAVAHHHVEEIWYIVGGYGQMWRRQGEREETVPLAPGTCISIPVGTHFQFRAAAETPTTKGPAAAEGPAAAGVGPLAAVGVTMPPWPGDDEAYEVPGTWPPDPSGPPA